jgi:hypothetical protein
MFFFSKKQEVRMVDFCRGFYDENIMNPSIPGVNANDVFFETIRKQIGEADNRFNNIDSAKFAAEMLVLRFEAFALAWVHKFGDKSAVEQTVFTKQYLHEQNRDDIWEALEPYNQAIARSIKHKRSAENPLDRAFVAHVNQTRLNLFKQFQGNGYDPKCVARALNRLFFEEAWKNQSAPGFLMFALCDRLGFPPDFKPNNEGQFRIIAIISGFYDGALQAMEKIKLRA